MLALDKLYEAQGKIGGPGHVVEIDEMKIGHTKYNVGRFKDGHWILGMIDAHSKDFRLEIIPNNQRNTATLQPLIQKHVERGSVIMTDSWSAYNNLETLGYEHLTVNHSQNFVDPQTFANTQTIESSWRFLRHTLERSGIRHEHLDMHLCEFLFRRECKKRDFDPFSQIIYTISLLYPGK